MRFLYAALEQMFHSDRNNSCGVEVETLRMHTKALIIPTENLKDRNQHHVFGEEDKLRSLTVVMEFRHIVFKCFTLNIPDMTKYKVNLSRVLK